MFREVTYLFMSVRLMFSYYPYIGLVWGVYGGNFKSFSWPRIRLIQYVLTLILIFGVWSNSTLVNLVEAFVGVQNFVTADSSVEDGLSIYKYESETLSTYTTAAEFNGETISTDSFETGADLEVVTDTNDFVKLGHYGDNEPDIAGNGDWWDDDSDPATLYNWRYRQCFDVDYSAGTTDLMEQQIYLDFDTTSLISGGFMQSQGEDIRFVDYTGSVIPHYIADDINTSSTRIWVQPSMILSGSNETYCMYYGNPTATSTSDRDEVFTYLNRDTLYYVLAENADNDVINFGSYVDLNDIAVDSYDQTYSKYEQNSVSSGPGGGTLPPSTDLRARGPIQATIGSSNVDTVVPASSAGTEFTYRADRYEHVFDFVSPFCSANVEIYNTTNLGATVPGGSFAISQGGSYTWDESVEGTGSFANDDAVYITSTNSCPILAFHTADSNRDTFPMFPSTTEDWYGVGSNSLEVSASTTTTIDIYDSGNNTPAGATLNAANDYHISDNGAGSQGAQPAQRIVVTSGGGIGAKSIADGDGTESSTFLPRSEMDTKYIIPENVDYLTVSSIAGVTTTIEVYNDAADCTFGNTSPAPNQTFTATSTGLAPGHALTGALTQGTCIVTDHPIAPYYEKQAGGDETNMWSYKQGRQRVQIDPSISIGVVETGTWNVDGTNTWNSRLPVTVTNNVASTLSEYPVRISLSGQTDLLTNAQAGGGDIRVAGSVGDGTDIRDYYLEEFGNIYADDGDIWTQVDVNGSGSSVVYIYYNATTTLSDQSSQDDVFSYTNAQPLYYTVSSLASGNFNIYSYINNNTLFFLGETYTGLDVGENYTDPGVGGGLPGFVIQGEEFEASGPISGGFVSDATDAVHPLSWAGTKFLTADTRYEQEFALLAPFADATVTFEENTGSGWTALGAPVSLTTGVVENVIRNTQNGTGSTPANGMRITSTTPIIAFTHGNNGGNAVNDSLLLYPVEETFEESTGNYELYGVSSSTLLLTTENASTNVEIFYDDGTSSGLFSVTTADSNIYVEGGGGSQGTGRGMKIVADGPIGAQSQADADGTESVVYLPKKEFADEYLVVTGTQYISIVSNDPGTVCEIFDTSDVSQGSVTLSTNSSTYVNQGELGDTTTGATSQFTTGFYMTCTDPVYAYYEKNGDDSDAAITDETTFLSFPQARKTSLVTPVVSDIDAVEVIEEGLYYESGFDSATTGAIPSASITFEIDGNTLTNPDHIAWNDIEWLGTFPAQTATNSVNPIEVDILSGDDNDCSTATYTLLGILTTSGEEIPVGASDNTCLRGVVKLQTGDPAYTPELTEVTFSYTDPILVDDIYAGAVINIDGNISATSVKKRIIKLVTTNTNLGTMGHELSYISGTETGDFTNFDLETVDLSVPTTTSQFDFPAFPSGVQFSGNQSDFSTTADNAINLDHARIAGNNATFVIDTNLFVNGSTVQLNRPITINISGS